MAEGIGNDVSLTRRRTSALIPASRVTGIHTYMFDILKQTRAAFSHLNPQEVRILADRTLRVGLIAGNDSAYRGMEEILVPSSVPDAERIAGRRMLFRGGDPDAPATVDLVLYDEGIPVSNGAYVLCRDNPGATLDAILHDNAEFELPLARQFPGFRPYVVDRIVQTIAKENALFAVTTALPDLIPNLVELPWALGEWASDTAFLTANQVRMAFLISAACGKEIGFGAQKGQLMTIGAGAFGWRALARELAGKIPFGGGLLAKGAIAYAGTVLVGKGLEFLHREQVAFSPELKRKTYTDALERGREIARSWLPKGVKV
jgi:hypothetical protein